MQLKSFFALFVFLLALCVLPSQQSSAQWDACLPLAETPSECDSVCTATSCPTGQSCTPVYCNGGCVAGCKCGTYLDCDFDGSAGAVCKGMAVRDDKPTFCLPYYDTCLGTVDDIPTEPCVANPNICATSGGTCDAFLGNSNYNQNKGVWPECTTLSWTYICQCGYENTDPCQPGYLCSDVAGCVPQQDGCLIDDTVCSPCETCSPFDKCEPSGQLEGCQLLDLQAGEPEAYDFGLDNDEGDEIELRLEPCSGRLEWTVYEGRSPNTKNSQFDFSASKDGLESVGIFTYSSGSSTSFNFVAKALNGEDATFRAYLYEYNKPNPDPLFPRLGGKLGSQEVAWKYTNNRNSVVLSWPSSPDNSRVEYCVYASPTAVDGVYELHGSPCAIDETTLVECVTDKTSLTVDISSAADADWYFDVIVQWQEGQGPSEDNEDNLGLPYRAAYVAASTLVPSGTGGNDHNNDGGSSSSGSSSSGSNSSSGASTLAPLASLMGLLIMSFLYLVA